MGRESVIRVFFNLLHSEMENYEFSSDQIFNVDETGFGEGQYCSRVKSVCERGVKHPYIRFAQTREHITALVCASASGKVIPPMIIFKNTFPHSSYASEGVSGSLYAVSESGHIDSALYISFITKLFIPSIPTTRPVLLLQDSPSSHMSFELIKVCRENNIILLNFPPHTTHILQPLDHLFESLKSKFTSTARTASLLRENLIITKNKFTPVFKQALTTLTPDKVCKAFNKTGVYPLNPDAIGKSKLISDTNLPATHINTSSNTLSPVLYMECTSEPNSPTLPLYTPSAPQGTQTDQSYQSSTLPPLHLPSTSPESSAPLPSTVSSTISQPASSSSAAAALSSSSAALSSSITTFTQTSPIQGHCTACNTTITENPLVKAGLVSPSLANVLWVPPSSKKITGKRKLKSKVLTSDEAYNEFKLAVQEKENQAELKRIKQEQRENLRIAKLIEKEERKQEKITKQVHPNTSSKKQTPIIDHTLCKICHSIDPPRSYSDFTDWITCELCDNWFHVVCTNKLPCENVFICSECFSK